MDLPFSLDGVFDASEDTKDLTKHFLTWFEEPGDEFGSYKETEFDVPAVCGCCTAVGCSEVSRGPDEDDGTSGLDEE